MPQYNCVCFVAFGVTHTRRHTHTHSAASVLLGGFYLVLVNVLRRGVRGWRRRHRRHRITDAKRVGILLLASRSDANRD